MLPKWMLALIVVLSLVSSVNFFIVKSAAPEGKIFVEYGDDVAMLTLMKSIKWGFTDPFSDKSIFSQTLLVSPFTFVPLGVISYFLSIDNYSFLLFVKILASFAYVFTVYKFIRFFYPSYEKLGLALFLLAGGIGGWLYVLFFAGGLDTSVVGSALSYDYVVDATFVNIFTHLTRIYWMLPGISGLASIMFFARGRYILSGVLLGAAFLLYPMFGLGFAIIVFIYSLIYSKNLKEVVKGVLPAGFAMFAVSLPLLYSYFSDDYYVRLYVSNFFGTAYLLKLIVSFLPLAALSVYYFKRGLNTKHRLTCAIGTVLTVLFIYHQISSSLFFVEYVFAAFVLAVLFIIFRSRVEKEDKFILMWVVAMVWFSVASTYIVPWNPQKFPFFLLLPLSVLGAKGALKLSKNYNVGLNKIIIVLVLVAVPNSVLYNINVQVSYRNSERAYMQEEIFGAIERLNDLPQDRVFSSGKTGYFIPYYGGQKTVYFGLGDIEAEKTYDTVRFYNADDATKLAILKKYGASYVFYGPEEMSIGNASFGKEHFTVVYNNSQVTIYGVAA